MTKNVIGDQPQKAADEQHQRAEMELRGKADYEKRVKEALKERSKLLRHSAACYLKEVASS
jgi:hypothetical protein